MGIDAVFGSFNFGIVVTQLTYGKAEVVVFTEKYERPNFPILGIFQMNNLI